MASYIFDPSKGESPETLARQRAIAEALLARGGSPNTYGEGINAMLSGIAAGIMNHRAKKGEAKGQSGADQLWNNVATSTMGREAFPPTPGGSSSASAPESGGGSPIGEDIRAGIIQTAEALGIDPVDLGTAISYETAGTFDPAKKGPTTQWGQHKGLIQFGEPQAQKYGVDWENPIGSQLGPDGAVAKYLRDTGVKPGMGMLDIYSAINAGRVGRYNASDANNGGAPGNVRDKVTNQMAGHRKKAMALLGQPDVPPAVQANENMANGVQVASLDPAAGFESVPPTDAGLNAPGSRETIARLLTDRRMGGAPQSFAPQGQPPVQMAQAGPPPEMAGQEMVEPGGPSMEMLMRASGDPFMSPARQRILGALMEQQMQKSDPGNQLDLEYKRAQIEKMRREAANPGSDETFYGNAVPMENPDGSISYGQMGNKGTFRPVKLPDGQKFAPPTKQVDTGTEVLHLDQAGNVIARVPKQNFEEARDKAEGTATGKVAGEVKNEYDSITSKMPGLRTVMGNLSDLADKATYTSAGQLLDSGRKQLGLEPRDAAVARSQYTAIIDNQILPLLRDTFGAQFTAAEGDKLARTLGDPDMSPSEKHAVLTAFIEQKERDVEALRSRVAPGSPPSAPAAEDPLGIR